VLVGLSTQFENAALTALDNVILGIFVVEVVAKLSSDEKHPLTFFKDNWNVFDFVVVAGSIIPMLLRLDIASMISMLRLLRLLRVLKLVKSLPRLKIIVDALIDGFGSMFYLCVLMFLVFFLFAIVGMMLFEQNDPWHYGTLNSAMLSLFRISTLEDWTDIMFINQYGCDAYGWQVYPALSPCAPRPMGWWSVLYHVVFTVLSSMVLLTTFLGVVVTSMDKASSAQRSEARLAEQMKELSEKKGMSIASLKILKGAFKLIDIDDGGDIDAEEVFPLLTALCPAATSDQLANLFLAVDSDSSGAIEFDEFVELLLLLRQVTEGGPGALDRFNEPPGKGAAAAAAAAAGGEEAEEEESRMGSRKGEDIQHMQKALGLLVKHRGGGPFGLGRLPASEAAQLEASLTESIKVLNAETARAYGTDSGSSDDDDSSRQ